MMDRLAITRFLALARRKGTLALCLALCALGLSATAHAQKIITFNAPGAGTGVFQGTYGSAVNLFGSITGNYIDSSNVYHGFLRAPNGAITEFDAPGAGTGAGQGTMIDGLNNLGVIVGHYFDASWADHGFLRAPNGTITTFNAPGAGGAWQGTAINWINNFMVMAGNDMDSTRIPKIGLTVPF